MSANRITSAAAFFAAAVLAQKAVPLPDGGGVVQIRELTAAERSEFSKRSRETPTEAGAWLVITVCLDDNGDKMFSEDDIGAMMIASPRFVEHVAFQAMMLSGLFAKREDVKND